MKVEKNVLGFCEIARTKVGNYEAEMFDVNLSYQIDDYKIESPIEQLLYVALHCVARILSLGNSAPVEIQGEQYLLGFNVLPQFTVGKYRVDFKVSYFTIGHLNKVRIQKESTLLIECDSQQFHDRTEPERRYEKKRDRYLQSMGYKVFRFTGSEIVKNPLAIAAEIVSHATGTPECDILGQLDNY